ncbi:hypothetical protein B0H13DRAFT_2262922 [Mycena leptocephala]|nr:hypothetical protein B0H13DRAFT_2262922 [Mycena leptocephala]
MRRNNPYGEGAPHGDPFLEQVPQHPQAYPQLPTHSREVPRIGRGPPPTPSRHGRSVSFESPVVDRHHASGNPAFFDAAVTPTPNRINYPPQRAQYGPSTDQLLFTLLGKMDAVLDENRNLVNCVGELTHRVTVLEQGAHAPQAGRRRGPQRGRAIARAPSTRRSVLHRSPSSESIDPVLRGVEALDNTSETTTDTATGSEFSDDVDDHASSAGNDNEGPVVIDEGMLTKAEKKAVRLRISQIFRQVCNVFGKEWPNITEVRVNPITNQQYPTLNFAYDVLNIHNCALFRKVGERAQRVLADKAAWPKALKRLKTLGDPITWELDFTTDCAKQSFRSYKKQWNGQVTGEGREKAEEKEKRDRRTQRRVTKSEQIEKVVEAVAEDTGMDVAFLRVSTHPEYLSDEVSGPESDSETPEDWKFRLATLANLRNDPTSLKATHILEVLIPGWRDEQYTQLIHSLQNRHQKKGKGNSKQYHRVYAGRLSTRIPRYAPYNSGIKQDWLEDSKKNPDLALQIMDWGNYSEPAGCEFKSIPSPT